MPDEKKDEPKKYWCNTCQKVKHDGHSHEPQTAGEDLGVCDDCGRFNEDCVC